MLIASHGTMQLAIFTCTAVFALISNVVDDEDGENRLGPMINESMTKFSFVSQFPLLQNIAILGRDE